MSIERTPSTAIRCDVCKKHPARCRCDLTEQLAEKIMESPSLGELVLTIVEEAFCKFDDAGAAEDFGLQHVGPGKIVFGRTNRVTWSASEGFVADESYCTERFMQAWVFGVDPESR